MHVNLIAFAVPVFAGLMGAEFWLAQQKRKPVFHFAEAIANLNVGIGERLADMLTTGAFFWLFEWIYQHCRLFTIPGSWLTYTLLFIVTDFLWYWYHRFGHQVSLLWAAHGVHHQSTDFNYTVSARITVIQAAFRSIFWMLLPLLGFHPAAITVMLLFHGAYPFFTHTQLIGKLGWLEYVFVTPTHHSVHHSSNSEYLDKNFGDVLIVWDKIFGTFAERTAAPVYGLTKPLNSYSFLWQHFHFFLEIGVAFARASGWQNKLKIVTGRPDRIDPNIRPVLERKFLHRTSREKPTRLLYRYIMVQTVITLTVLFLLLLCKPVLDDKKTAVAALFILLSVINTGAMLEQRRWVFALETGRIILCGLWSYFSYPGPIITYIFIVALTVIALFYRSARACYLNLLYPTA